MCTALSFQASAHYFGRTLDLDGSYGEQVCILPRNFPLAFRKMDGLATHYAMIGMAVAAEGFPLFYDAVNEKGLGMAGLNFPGNACYHPEKPGCDNVTPFELIPWILGQCASCQEARALLERLNLADIPFSEIIPLAPLHWMISDRTGSLVVESVADGLHVYENPAGVLTNNPPFPYQLFNLNNYRSLSPETPDNSFSEELPLEVYCQGLGGLGLPGDVSSMSRFVRGAFYLKNSACDGKEESGVSQFFHLLGAVEMPRGACRTEDGDWDITVYSCCVSTGTGRYYYTTYDNRQINCVDMRKADLEGRTLTVFPLERKPQIRYQNSI